MNRFQILLVIFFGMGAALSAIGIFRSRSRGLALLMFVVCLGACAASIWPDATTDIAKWMGITSGTNLIVYCTALVVLIGFFLFYIRLRQLRRELTLVVRHVAILEASERPTHGDSAQENKP